MIRLVVIIAAFTHFTPGQNSLRLPKSILGNFKLSKDESYERGFTKLNLCLNPVQISRRRKLFKIETVVDSNFPGRIACGPFIY